MTETNASLKTLLDGYLEGASRKSPETLQVITAYSNLILADAIDDLTELSTGSYGLKAVFAPTGTVQAKVATTAVSTLAPL